MSAGQRWGCLIDSVKEGRRVDKLLAQEREACAKLGVGLDLCAQCNERLPACVGRYEDDGEPEPACDECCGHGNEDGHCVPVAEFIVAAIRARRP